MRPVYVVSAWLSLITIVLLALVLFASRHELVSAWALGQVNLWGTSAHDTTASGGLFADGEDDFFVFA